jgi:DNA-binding NarL/FixJ family response regulator
VRPAPRDWFRCEEETIEQIRVVLADVPALMADLVEQIIDRQPDMVVVGRLTSPAGLPDLTRTSSPDVIVIGLDEPRLPPGCVKLFSQNGLLTVLGLQRRRGLAHVYRLLPDHRELGEVAPVDLVTHIRTAGHRLSFP